MKVTKWTTVGMRTDRELVECFAGKAPVCVCRPRNACNVDPGQWCGPQRAACAARRELERRGYAMPEGLGAALSHALDVGEGRAEFDALMAAWRRERGLE